MPTILDATKSNTGFIMDGTVLFDTIDSNLIDGLSLSNPDADRGYGFSKTVAITNPEEGQPSTITYTAWHTELVNIDLSLKPTESSIFFYEKSEDLTIQVFGNFEPQPEVDNYISDTYQTSSEANTADNLFMNDFLVWQESISLSQVNHAIFSNNSFHVEVTSETSFLISDEITGELLTEGSTIIYGSPHDDLLNGGNGDDQLYGEGGSDQLAGLTGDDFLRGGDGIDTALYTTNRTDFLVQIGDESVTVIDNVTTEGTDTLVGIERLQFADTNIALDLDGHAGTTAKILGAVFGAESVSNAGYVGIGLGLLDGGMDYEALMSFAIDAAGANTNEAVVHRLWENLVGSAPTADQAAPYIALLDNGTHTAGSLGVFAADLELNATNIDLVGLAQSGIEFI